MSEQKRPPFQSLGTTKKEKKGEELVPSYRFALTLPESNEQACPEFNYRELLKSAEKKRKKESGKKGDEINAINGLDPHDDDDTEKLQEMVRRFEARHGTATAGSKKHNRYDDYVDLGAGYDESDSFIDNTDAYDEIVPEEMTTVRGGFYINSGPLEFKSSEGNSLIKNNNNNNNVDDDDDSSDSSKEDPEEIGSPKQLKKRILSTSEEEETEDGASDHQPKKAKLEDNGDKNSSNDIALKKKKKQELSILNRQKNPLIPDTLKDKREIRESDLRDDQEGEKKRGDKVESNKPKSILEKKFDIKRCEKKTPSNGMDVQSEVKKVDFYDDTIESVVNAARVDDQSSSDTMDSGKSRSIACSNSDYDEATDKKEFPLPDSLSEDMKEIINNIKLHARNNSEGKNKKFSGPINSGLFSLEKKLRLKCSVSERHQTYDHLAVFLPCSKPTLVNRVKKLYLKEIEDKVNVPLERLKATIDRIMPSVLTKYTRDCQKVADEKGIEGSPVDGESSDGEDSGNKSSEKSKILQRRFPWNDEMKRLVFEIAAARREYFKILKPRKETFEAFLSSFMDAKVRPLWPPGWVRLQTLLKYSNSRSQIKSKSKKLKDGSVTPGMSVESVGSSTVGTTSKTETHLPSNDVVGNQERVKTPTNFSETVSISENQRNSPSSVQGPKSNETNVQSSQLDKKSGSKSKDKNQENPVTSQYTSTSCTITNSSAAKISVIPTSQLMAPKSKSDKFNPIDLTSSSLSITPVNDYQKSGKTSESKDSKRDVQDTISITPCTESTADSAAVPQSVNTSQANYLSLPQAPTAPSIPKPVPLKHRILQDSLELKDDKGSGEKDSTDTHKTDRKEKKEKRHAESRHKSHDIKKRKKEHKVQESASVKVDSGPTITPFLSKKEQDQLQDEETMAATNYLSQIINNDVAPRPVTNKRKETNILDEPMIIPPSEQENDVQMVMRSLKELQELQEMKYSPSHSPVSVIQKPSKSSSTNMQYVNYQDDYQRLYVKKEDKIRDSETDDTQWF